MASRNYRDLIVWQKAMQLVTAVYRASKQFPSDERFGIISQIRRAAVSVLINIAEGEGRGGAVEFVRFLQIAHGSLREVETLVLLSEQLAYSDRANVDSLMESCAEVGRLINGLIRAKRGRG